MPFSPIKIRGNEPVLSWGIVNDYDPPTDGGAVVVALDVPAWHWTPWSWSPPRRTFTISALFPTNTGVYGPNPPELSGAYGKATGPNYGTYAPMYRIVRSLDPGRYYLVIRPQVGFTLLGKVSVEVV